MKELDGSEIAFEDNPFTDTNKMKKHNILTHTHFILLRIFSSTDDKCKNVCANKEVGTLIMRKTTIGKKPEVKLITGGAVPWQIKN